MRRNSRSMCTASLAQLTSDAHPIHLRKYWGATDPSLTNIQRFTDIESGLTCKFLTGNADHMLQIPGYEK